jgi:hypothetical protein
MSAFGRCTTSCHSISAASRSPETLTLFLRRVLLARFGLLPSAPGRPAPRRRSVARRDCDPARLVTRSSRRPLVYLLFRKPPETLEEVRTRGRRGVRARSEFRINRQQPQYACDHRTPSHARVLISPVCTTHLGAARTRTKGRWSLPAAPRPYSPARLWNSRKRRPAISTRR